MNFCQVCVMGLCFAILENVVTGNYCENNPARGGPFLSPFYFRYMSRDIYNIVLKLKNVSRKITAVLVAVQTDDAVSRYKWDGYEKEQYRICGDTATNSKVTIGLELYSSNVLCATRLVSEGRHVRTLRSALAFSKYTSPTCITFSNHYSCDIEIDLSHDCIDTPRPTQSTPGTTRHETKPRKPTTSYTPKDTHNVQNTSRTPNHKIFVTPKPAQNNPDDSRNTSVIPKPEISYTPEAPQNIYNISNTSKSRHNISDVHNKNTVSDTTEAALNTSDSHQEARNISVTSNVTRVTSDSQPNAVDSRSFGADSRKHITITIISAVSVLVLILLVVVMWKCCWIKRSPSASSRLLTNDLGDSPFYLNMLFRKECDQEIEQLEQHHYEEVKPQ